MNFAADTNVLLRIAVRDNEAQAGLAEGILRQAVVVVVSMLTLCEFVWVLKRSYRFTDSEVSEAIAKILAMPNVLVDRDAVDAGLAFLTAGGDFADGVIAFEGRELGAVTFVSFDRQAVAILQAQGHFAQLLG